MKRIKGFEWEDQPWFPPFLRRYMMDFLRFVLNTGNLYQPVTHILWQGLQHTGSRHVVDLCSGAGGAIAAIQNNLRAYANGTIPFILTDLYPDEECIRQLHDQSAPTFSYYPYPVNAADVPPALQGFRTLFSAFHHFDAAAARRVLQNAVDAREGIAIFDGGSRSIGFIILILLFQPVAFLLFTPFIKPLSFGRLVFTYLLPVVPFCTMWDGVMSVLRLYSHIEMRQIASCLNNSDGYVWQDGKVRNRLGIPVAYLIGYPAVRKDRKNHTITNDL